MKEHSCMKIEGLSQHYALVWSLNLHYSVCAGFLQPVKLT